MPLHLTVDKRLRTNLSLGKLFLSALRKPAVGRYWSKERMKALPHLRIKETKIGGYESLKSLI